MIRQYELVERVSSYDPATDEELLNRAYVFSMKAHGAQLRASGDPYFSHPIEVAGILTDYHLDCATIATALLHDTVEDTVATLDEIDDLFGSEVAKLVDGVTKLSKLELRSEANREAENFRKLLLAMSDDIRVLLVKLADRLHNMRTLRFLKKREKRQRIAIETMEIYAPLAERLGMRQIRDELETLAFAELNADAHDAINQRLKLLREDAGNMVERVTGELGQTLEEAGIEAEISGREKKAYSVWRKMERDRVEFEQLADITAFRIVVDTVPQCYQALGIVHGRYRTVPGRFRDYISTPKRNGYRSIHTTVIGPERQRTEVQIRTREMHEVAEFGVAAHWAYKQGQSTSAGPHYRWLQEPLEILEHAESPEEFLEHTKLAMFQDQVFCFTPKGEVIALPRGATPVDFAYAVHTQVGDSCVGAKINGRVVPLRTELANGNQVDILRSSTSHPDPSWESFVVTGRARAAIRRFIRNRERAEHIRLGRAIVEKVFRQSGHEITEEGVGHVCKVFKMKDEDELYHAVGIGQLTSRQVLHTAFPGERPWSGRGAIGAINRVLPARWRTSADKGNGHAVPIKGLIPGMAVHHAPCCHPIPGDRIVGIVTRGKGVMIHTIDCASLEQFTEEDERWLDVKWDVEAGEEGLHVGRIRALVVNEPGGLSALSSVIAKNRGNISNLRFTNRGAHFFEMTVDIEVEDVKHLTDIITALRASPQINDVDRIRG
ncbi:MAG: bifunctional (p)ppGpp synthetase/guanosine-3',5'-bis(diphosphate) 3'-pyrophosphohydrolase [Proteobacteria bacterium]|nr:bifunctional (p)ppGpp synthetase/guanosine-3',5'-bis(diphosphate) 3'-pyrophosphohydrolase [Pseudomonadota bacterium]